MVHHPSDTGEKPRSGQAGNDRKPRNSPKGVKAEKPGAKPKGRGERVAKALARAGVASRRDVERLIGLGKVAVNGRIIDTPATFIHKDDILTVDGEVVSAPEATRVWRYHKPVGLMTTHRDPEGRPTVFDNLPKGLPRVISVGRLDINSEGLLLLTNDGELSRALELPTTGWKRVYRARAHGRITQEQLDRLKDGVEYEGVRYGPIEARLDKAKEKEGGGANVWITLTLGEGKYREVRKVLESLGLKVNRLIRLAYGPFQLGTLGVGEVEEIGPRVIREQLADVVLPENMPKGDRVMTPPPAPARRPIPGSAMANPKAKPSRVKENIAMREQRDAERAARNAERASARPRRDDDRPYRSRDAETPGRPRGSRTGDAKRSYGKPREDGAERPARSYGEKRPFKPRGERPEGDGRSFKPWEGAAETRGDERPRRGPGDKPRTARPGWAKPRPEGDRAERPAGKRPFKPRDGEGRPSGGKAPSRGKPGGKPGGPRSGPGGPRPGGSRGPRKPRSE